MPDLDMDLVLRCDRDSPRGAFTLENQALRLMVEPRRPGFAGQLAMREAFARQAQPMALSP